MKHHYYIVTRKVFTGSSQASEDIMTACTQLARVMFLLFLCLVGGVFLSAGPPKFGKEETWFHEAEEVLYHAVH